MIAKWSSASEMCTTHNIGNFEALLRKVMYGFMQRLKDSSNVINNSNPYKVMNNMQGRHSRGGCGVATPLNFGY